MKNSFNWKLGVWEWGTRPRVCVSRQSLHSPFVQPKQRQILCYFLFPNIGLKTQDLIYWFGSTYLISFLWTWSSDFTDVTLANGIIIHCLGMEPSLVSLYICTYLLIKHLNVFWYLNVYYKKLVIFNLQPLVTNQCMVRQQISFIFLDLISFIIFTTFSIMCSAFKTIFSRFSHHQSKFV